MKILTLSMLVYCGLTLVACQSKPQTPAPKVTIPPKPTAPPPKPTAPEAHDSIREAHDSIRAAANENYDTLAPATRSHFREVQAFLDLIKRPNSNTLVGPDEWNKSFHIGNIDSFLSFITVDSLEIVDADADPGKDSLRYSQATLRRQLTRRKGDAFEMIGEISLHISTPYPQYSHTTFSVSKTDSFPNLNVSFSDFQLYFRAEKGSANYKLYRLESYHISDL